jgi:hypothetical protein
VEIGAQGKVRELLSIYMVLPSAAINSVYLHSPPILVQNSMHSFMFLFRAPKVSVSFPSELPFGYSFLMSNSCLGAQSTLETNVCSSVS